MQATEPDHYATLGLDRECTETHIRSAYRLLAKQHHPDVNGGSAEAQAQTQALNAAYEILSDPGRRQAYHEQLDAREKIFTRGAGARHDLTEEVQLRLEEFFRGVSCQVRVTDPGASTANEVYELIIPPETAPGTRFRIARTAGGYVIVKVKARPDLRFQARGSDLRCELRISFDRAQKGGAESVRGVTGNFIRVPIPAKIKRGEVLRLPNEGLPKARGVRGDLLVRVVYRPEVRITRK